MLSPSNRGFAKSVRFGAYPERKERRLSAFDQYIMGSLESLRTRLVGIRERHAKMVDDIERLAPSMSRLTDREIRQFADALRPRLLARKNRAEAICESFALAREATHRALGLKHYRVQLVGGLCLLEGALAEMRTGEGKTIVALLPAITAALSGIPTHVVTVNDYLAKRDETQLAPVFRMLGISTGLIQAGQSPQERAQAYGQDVTYCTNKELVFDYLRDRIALQQSAGRVGYSQKEKPLLMLRGLHFAIIDEADSVLIDEARTPLIISAERDTSAARGRYIAALEIAGDLVEGEHYRKNIEQNSIVLTKRGASAIAERMDRFDGVWRSKRAREELLQQALVALHVFHKDRQYLVSGGKVRIVDEYTGRVMADRSWMRGLHQLIEIKEGCEMSNERESLAQITYQRFFRRYLRLAGMTGTAKEVAAELRAVYGLRTHQVPTNKPDIRHDLGIRIARTPEQKWRVVSEAVSTMQAMGRPVLIGTRSVADSETIAGVLTEMGIENVVLNARQDEHEAEAVASAGQRARVTVATNMAGRGTDISLGTGVGEIGGLHVILTEYHESARIDRQLIGRGGRQGDPGSFEAIVCLEDEIYAKFVPRLARWIAPHVSKQSTRHLGSVLRRIAQAAAERQHARTRRQIVKRDQDLDKAFAFAGRPD